MIKNIVICSDGTGNTFSKHVSNITRLIKSVELDKPDQQVVFYDQGIGTNPELVKEVEAYQNEPGKSRKGLTILPPPQNKFLEPLTRMRGLLFGYGLRDNVREMYKALAENYNGEKDQIFPLALVEVLLPSVYLQG